MMFRKNFLESASSGRIFGSSTPYPRPRRKVRVPAKWAAWPLAVIAVLGNYGYSQAPRSVTVSTEPGAAVWINDVRYGTADENGKFTARLVPAGRIKLRVRADGYSEGSKTLLPAQKGAVPITLVKTDDPAWLAFQEGERQSLLDRDKAITAYRNAVTLRPNFPEAYAALARILLEQGKYDAAEAAIRSARKYRVAYPEATAILGRLYKDTGDEAKAIATFRKAITEGGGYQPEAYTGLGLIYKDKADASAAEGDYAGETANYTESAKNFAKAADQLASSPDAPVLYQLLGLTYEKQKRYKEAIAVYQKFLLMFPDSVEAEAVRSFITQLEKQMDEPK